MWVTITAEYNCELIDWDATAIKNGEMTIQDIDTSWYTTNHFSTAKVIDIRES